MYCRNCGEQINEDAKFCRHCGASQTALTSADMQLSTPSQAIQQKPKSKWKKKNNGCVTAFLIATLSLFSVFIILINLPSNGGDSADVSVTGTEAGLHGEKSTKKQKYEVSIVSSSVEESAKGDPYIVINYDFKNNGTYAESFEGAFDVNIYQNGVQCLDYELFRKESERHQERANVQPGTTYRVRQAYRLYDTDSPIEYEINGRELFGTETYAKGTINLK